MTTSYSSARLASHAVSTYNAFRKVFASFPGTSSRPRRHAVAAGVFALSLLLLGAIAAPAHGQNVSLASVQTTVPTTGLSNPDGLAMDGAGDVFIADYGNSRVVEVTPGGVQTTVPTTGLSTPGGVAVDGAGDVFIADSGNRQVVKVPYLGNGTYGVQSTVFSDTSGIPGCLALDGAGNLYVVDTWDGVLWKVAPSGASASVSFVSSSGAYAIVVDGAGGLFVGTVDQVLEITAGGVQSTVASGLSSPRTLALDAAGDLFIADSGNNRVVEITPGGVQTTVPASGLSNPWGVAVDGAGDVFIEDTANNRVVELQPGAPSFGSANVCPAPQTTPAPCNQTPSLNYSVNADTTFGASPTVLTQGAPNLDFQLSSGSTCTGTVTAGNSCSVNVTFAPLAPGLRMGAVQLLDNSGNLLASTLVQGTGQGPQIAFEPASITTLGGGLNSPQGVAVDASGNVYFGEISHGIVMKKMPPNCTSSSCVTTLGGGFSQPTGVAVDGSGNVYVSDGSNRAVKEMPPNCASSICVTTLGGGFSNPTAVAVDGGGNVYVTDSGNNAVMEMPTNCTSSSCVTTLGGGFSFPHGVAVDGSGNVYVADDDNNAVKEIHAATLPSLTFASTQLGSTSSDSPQSVTIQNIGNQPLNAVAPGLVVTGPNFVQVAGSGTPADCGSGFSLAPLAPGAACNLSISFEPQGAGSLTSTAVFTDNTLNTSPSANQTIALQGVATLISQTLTLTVPPTAVNHFSFTVVVTGAETALTYSSSGACTNVGAIYTMNSHVGAACNETASAAASSSYSSATASGTTLVAAAIAPTVSITAPPSAAYNSTYNVTATTNASTSPTFSATPATVCSISGTTVTMLSGTGTCSVKASWAADDVYKAATSTAHTTASKLTPAAIFTGAPPTAVYLSSFTVATTQDPGDGVTPTFTATPASVCSISGANVTMNKGTGTCTVKASWAENTDYLATSLTQSVTATPLGTSTTITTASADRVKALVYFTVTNGANTVTGNVTVTASSGGHCTGTVAAGYCSLRFAVDAGSQTLTATYAGNTDDTTSTSVLYTVLTN